MLRNEQYFLYFFLLADSQKVRTQIFNTLLTLGRLLDQEVGCYYSKLIELNL